MINLTNLGRGENREDKWNRDRKECKTESEDRGNKAGVDKKVEIEKMKNKRCDSCEDEKIADRRKWKQREKKKILNEMRGHLEL